MRAKVVVFGQSGCIRVKRCCIREGGLFWAKWLYSGKSGSMRAKVVIFGKSDYIRVR